MARPALHLLLWAALCMGALADEVQPGDLRRLESAIAQLEQQLSRHRDEQTELQRQLRTNETRIGKLTADLERNTLARDHLAGELQALRQQRSELTGRREQQQVLIGAQLRRAYQLGSEKNLKVLLNQEDPAKLSRAIVYLDYFNRARLARLQAFTATLNELTTVEATIAAKARQQSALIGQLSAQKRQLEAERAGRQRTLASLTATIQGEHERLAQRQADRKRLEALLNTVEDVTASFAASQDARPFAERKGKMAWPVAGKVVSHFGRPRSEGGLRWQGAQIRAAEGTEVRAIHHGRVVFADWFRGQGLLIIIDHGDGYMSLYSHNKNLLRETGDWVTLGEPIATIGNSGGLNEYGLYFEIRHRGKASNPAQWCAS